MGSRADRLEHKESEKVLRENTLLSGSGVIRAVYVQTQTSSAPLDKIITDTCFVISHIGVQQLEWRWKVLSFHSRHFDIVIAVISVMLQSGTG